MDTFSAMAMGSMNRGNRVRVFDWDRAAKLIRESKPTEAGAGLSQDWEFTGGIIFRDGEAIMDREENGNMYLASTWATPELSLDGDIIDCWVWEDETEWSEKTYWPFSALRILEGEVIDGEESEQLLTINDART